MNTLQTIRTANRVVGTIAPALSARFARKLMMTPRSHDPRDWERDALERAVPVTFRFGLSGLRWGSSGPVVLAMHGWEGRPSQFARFIDPLLTAGRQVIALEAPGHGRSPGRESNVFRFTEALLEAATELRDIESVIGHSMGGSAALYAVHLGLPARRAVTIGSPAALSRVLSRFADWIALTPSAKQRFFDEVDRHVGVANAEIDMARLDTPLGIETLVVHDRRDRDVPFSEAQAMIAALPAARLFATEGLGHHRVLGDADVVRAAAEFLVQGRAPRIPRPV